MKVSIPNPCSENWNDMKASEKGRFCTKCATVVTDFTQKTKAEVTQFFQEASSKVCGRFRNDQLHVALVPVTTPSRKIRVFTCALYLVFGSVLFSCGGKVPTSEKNQKEGIIIETRGISIPSVGMLEVEEGKTTQDLINELNAQNEAQIQQEKIDTKNHTIGLPPPMEFVEGEVMWTEDLPFLDGDKIKPDSNNKIESNPSELPKIKMK